MGKITTFLVSSMISGMLILSGCSQQGNNSQATVPPQTESIKNSAGTVDNNIVSTDWESKYEVIKKIKFHVLINEYLDKNDSDNPEISILVREYWCFDGTGQWSQSYPLTNKIALKKLNDSATALDFKNEMKKLHPESLKLMENTIVSDFVQNQWDEQKYDTEFEYSKESPEGLTYEMLKKS